MSANLDLYAKTLLTNLRLKPRDYWYNLVYTNNTDVLGQDLSGAPIIQTLTKFALNRKKEIPAEDVDGDNTIHTITCLLSYAKVDLTDTSVVDLAFSELSGNKCLSFSGLTYILVDVFEQDNVKLLNYFIKLGMDPNYSVDYRDGKEMTMLDVAIIDNRVDIIKYLLTLPKVIISEGNIQAMNEKAEINQNLSDSLNRRLNPANTKRSRV